jgi:ABC-type phosphate/phosphonate transport system ATPase subunit
MLIAIVGTRCAGKSTIEDYFVSRLGFISVRIVLADNSSSELDSAEVRGQKPQQKDNLSSCKLYRSSLLTQIQSRHLVKVTWFYQVLVVMASEKTLSLSTILPRTHCAPLIRAHSNMMDCYVSPLRNTFCTMLPNVGNIILSQLIFRHDNW